MTPADTDWIDGIARDAQTLSERSNRFVHGDCKLDNMTVAGDGWRVGGIFDFHTARFGDGAFDLVHQTCAYLDTEPSLARVFIDAYRREVQDDAGLAAWMPLYVVKNRVGLWHYFVRADRPTWTRGKTFRDWAEPYVAQMLQLL